MSTRSQTAEKCSDLVGPEFMLECIDVLEPILGVLTEAFLAVYVKKYVSDLPSLMVAMAKVHISNIQEEEEQEEEPKKSSPAYKKVWITKLEDGDCPEFVVENLTHLMLSIGLKRFYSDQVLGPDVLCEKLDNSAASLLNLLQYATANLPAGSFPETREGLVELLSQRVFVPKKAVAFAVA